MKKRNKIVFSLLLVLVIILSAIGGTTAFKYYAENSDVINRMETKGSSSALKEIFNPSDLWVPGETKQKEVSFANTGEQDQVLRFKAYEAWFDNKGTPNDITDDALWSWTGDYSPAPATINWTSEITGPSATWVKIGNYYYYNKVLSVGATTPRVTNSVTFSNKISNDCPGAENDFSNKRYSLTFEMETLSVNTVETTAAWGVTFTKSGNNLVWS